MTGLPLSVPPSTPLVASYSSTSSRVRSLWLGSYSPLRGILNYSMFVRYQLEAPFDIAVTWIHRIQAAP